jgi:type IV pilus assembly protein PilQ
MKRNIYIITIFGFLLLSLNTYGQDRIQKIENQLTVLTTDMPGLDEKVQMSVSGVSIQEFMRGIADAHKLNISVDPSIQQTIVNNFSNATVSDVLIFICKEYNLSINFIGSIMSIVKYSTPEPIKTEPIKQELKISYDLSKDELTLDLKNDSIDAVVKAITQKSQKNVILASGISPKLVSVYIENMPFDNAIEKFGVANNLVISKTNDGFYLISNDENAIPATNSLTSKNKNGTNKLNTSKKTTGATDEFSFDAKNSLDISVIGTDVSIDEVIKSIAQETSIDYYFISEIKDKTTINVRSTSFQGLLDNMFQGTELTYTYKDGIYIIGERKTEGLRNTKVVQLQHRSVEKINDIIPADIKKNVDVKEFVDLNSLILSGSQPRIDEIELFIRNIDKIVPVVMIEVMIVDYSNKRTNTSGIDVGLGENPAKTTATLLSEPNIGLGSSSINNLIESFNGYGILNLGKVTPNFYVNIRALESQGVLKVKSTPKLATLNGHEAKMSVGNTEYYFEEQQTTTSNASTNTIKTRTYKSVKADLSVTIKPFVSGDDQITLEVSVSQSDFTGKIEPGAPPGSVSREFTSLIRVKDQEMVLLGGLEEKSVSESGSGVPFLARIPIIKWFFSSRSKEKSKSKLNIFIKPTVIY